jgi:hypothetical protein
MGEEAIEEWAADIVSLSLGTRQCSAAGTSAAGVSVSPEEGRRSAGHGRVVAAGDKWIVLDGQDQERV